MSAILKRLIKFLSEPAKTLDAAYLAKAQNHADLERRMREIEKRGGRYFLP